jgi:hypothetical protein
MRIQINWILIRNTKIVQVRGICSEYLCFKFFRDLCAAHPDNLPTMLKQTIFNELSNAR